jgi:hypothetical protein
MATLVAGIATFARAQTSFDPMDLHVVDAGHGKIRVTVSAGPSGAPNGFAFWWMTESQFNSINNLWPTSVVPGESWSDFEGRCTLNTWGTSTHPFMLGPNESTDIELGDLFDETGIDGTHSELQDAEGYVFCAFALGGADGYTTNGPLSVTQSQATTEQGTNCTYTIGYWKNHAGSWPVTSLTLGTVTYTQSQLLQIFNQPAQGNGLISLAHQLIGAKLNIAGGADNSTISATIAAADAQIGSLVIPPIGSGSLSPGSTSARTQSLDDYNNGLTGPGHCGTTAVQHSTWGAVKTRYR